MELLIKLHHHFETEREMDSHKCKLLIIYGSQTGQSKSIAEDIKTKAESQNYDVELLSMDESVEKVLILPT